MEKISARLTDYILNKGLIKKEDYNIYQYGFLCFLETTVGILSCIIISIIVGMFWEGVFFLLVFMPLRSFGGGLHLEKFYQCFIVSCLIMIASLLIVKSFSIPKIISLSVVFLSSVALLLIGPVDHPNREVEPEDNLIFIRKTKYTVFICMLVSIVLFFFDKTTYLFLEAVIFVILFITNCLAEIKKKLG
ncbi:MAG: accessory gene regulator B family protein [Pseudobutyrivibrio sp.]|nr:accessory gene regulator B family protein [Pseudobutyrivibrio sp.]